MEIIAIQRYVRQAPRKVRLVANSVKELPLEQALRQLAVIPRAATLPVLKTLRQAVANAQHNHGLSPADLQIKELIVNDGAIQKRWRAVSRGRAHSIHKRTCHIRVTLVSATAPEASAVKNVASATQPSSRAVTQAVATKAKVKAEKSAKQESLQSSSPVAVGSTQAAETGKRAGKSTKPAEPAKLTEPAKPVEPTQPTQPTQPTKSTNSVAKKAAK